MPRPIFNHDPAPPSPHAEKDLNQDLVTVLDDLFELHVLLVGDVRHHPSSHCFSSQGLGLGGQLEPPKLDVRVHELDCRVVVAAVEGLVSVADVLHGLGLHAQFLMLSASGISSVDRKIIATPMPTMNREP